MNILLRLLIRFIVECVAQCIVMQNGRTWVLCIPPDISTSGLAKVLGDEPRSSSSSFKTY